MKIMRWIAAASILLAAPPAFGQDKKDPSPAGKAAKRAAELLQPGGVAAAPFATGPQPRRWTWWIEHPEAPLPVFQGLPIRLGISPIETVKPPHPPEELPLVRYR